MAKNLKLKITNTQLAKAAGLDKLKAKLAREPATPEEKPKKKKVQEEKELPEAKKKLPEEPRRIRAKSKSAFAPIEDAAIEKRDELQLPEPSEDDEFVEEPEVVEVQQVVETQEEVVSVEEPSKVKLGPTGKHVKDLLPPKKEEEEAKAEVKVEEKPKKDTKEVKVEAPKESEEDQDKGKKGKKVKEFKDFKPKRPMRSFEPKGSEDDEKWRKKRHPKMQKEYQEELIIRPTELSIRLPISVKDLAQEMKLKASELIAKLLMQGLPLTLNDRLADETVIQLLGEEFGCKITFDTAEAEKIRITDLTVKEEIAKIPADLLELRPPVVAFMGHVDHGKTSLIDRIRQTNLAATEAGAITQHIGAFRCKTAVGDITILDTPGHEAFSSMRARGAEVTDIVVLVVAGDEGLREQTIEAIQHARAAKVTIVVALNKSDKPTFNVDKAYQQLAEQNLLPEAWGGQTITVNTSAVSGQGIPELLEMLALQAEVLELRANPNMRARGTVLESELHKGLGVVATVLVQNGSLKHGDAVVFARHFGRIKTMHDEFGKELEIAGPSTPVAITGLSGLPAAGDPFIVVANEKIAREIAEARATGRKEEALLLKKRPSMELLQAGRGDKKVLKLLLRADVQGSMEALKASLLKIHSDKVDLDIIFTGVGEVSESDIQLASASHAVIIGFHTQIESHAEMLIKELGVAVRLHNIIYHAIEEVQGLMLGMLDKIEEEKEVGKAEVQAVFKASQLGLIAGCIVTEGVIQRNNVIRVEREGAMIWKGSISSLKRVKEDVKEVKKGLECGILLDGFNTIQVGDIIHGYEITYRTQEL